MFGLPLHPFVVHGAVVLVPLVTVALIAALAARQWKGVVPIAVAALAVVGAVFGFLAAQSGGTLEDEVEDRAESTGQRFETDDHEEAGELAKNLSIALAVVTVVAAAAPYVFPQTKEFKIQAPMLGVAIVVGLAASWFMLDAGHSGAALVWDDPGNFVVGDGSGVGGGEDHDDDDDDD